MILVVDDDAAIRTSLKLLLGRAGLSVELVADSPGAINAVRASRPELVLLDMNFSHDTSGIEGLTLLKQIRIFRPDVPIILMTAWGSIPLAVEGMKAGASDFITKPWDNRALLNRIATLTAMAEPAGDANGFDRSLIVGNSPALMNVLKTVERIAATSASVLIMGENGTGKELIAETIHRNSPRASKPFVKVNLGGIPEGLFESEMFGHRKGAFTGAVSDRKGRFELADHGTIFLDEIGELDAPCQVKLLRVLQEGTFEPLGDSRTRRVDLRVISATNAPLPDMVADRRFREDLFYRLNLITLTLPPLRERNGDIPLLARHFARLVDADTELTADAITYLETLPFLGNIRELKNTVERAILVSGSKHLTADDFRRATLPPTRNVVRTIDENERLMIEQAINACGGNLSKVAARLGISRQALYRRMEKHGLRP